jgi:drug/metabolite transporter (DMT)-like permease
MLGYALALGAAFSQSFQNFQIRKLPHVDTLVLNWFRFLGATVILGALVTFFHLWQVPTYQVLLILAVTIPIEFGIAFCQTKAFQLSPQSLVGPLSSLTAIFLVPVGYFALKEIPSLLGVIGIFSILLGGFFLGQKGNSITITKWTSSILEEPGAVYMFCMVLLATASTTLAKISFNSISPILFGFYATVLLLVAHTPFVLKAHRHLKSLSILPLALISGTHGLGVFCHYVGLSLLYAAYFISLKRLSAIFDVLFGWKAGEKHIRERFIAAVFMAAGAVLVFVG